MTGVSALYAQKQAAEDQRRSEQESERREVNATLNALKTELKKFRDAFVTGTEAALKEWVTRIRRVSH